MQIRMPLPAIYVMLVTLTCCTQFAQAQGRWPYTPSRPTISTYHGLNRFNTGGIPNYYAFVRRDDRIRRFARRQHESIQAIEREIQTRESSEPSASIDAATYLNYSHFYQYHTPIRGRR